ncbi:MAG: hypothetical protein ACRDNP_04885 [Gaiellaceae bacterium]
MVRYLPAWESPTDDLDALVVSRSRPDVTVDAGRWCRATQSSDGWALYRRRAQGACP